MNTKKTHHYPEVDGSPDFAKLEEQTLEKWKKHKSFQGSIDNRPAEINNQNNEFVFYDGPPFANGLPHYGHLLTGYIKDIVARYQTMRGKKVERRFGWDCHGLPAEMGAEKELGISGRINILEYGIEKFNKHCRTSVMKYTHEWQDYVTRQARWVDFEHDYKTMETPYMESVIWAFKELYNKGLVYESHRVMPYSWACETPLSNFETRMDNSYREKKSKAVTVAFTLKDKPATAPEGCDNYKLVAWTTTAWTLPSNLALAVHKDVDYVAVVKDKTCYIMAKALVGNYSKEFGEDAIENASTPFKGEELVGLSYHPLMHYFQGHPNAFKVLHGDFVTTEDGTGIVHLAPGFGEDDQTTCQANGISLVCPVDVSGKYTQEIDDFVGVHVFDANDEIIKKLKNQGDWLRTEQYIHNYPHCWRTDTPLIYKAVPSWYVEVSKFKDRMVELNQQINWIPDHVKNGLFGKWLENARDWSISRNRFWGTPIPIWRSDDPRYPRIDVYGSIEELEKDFGVEVTDLHRPFIDELVRPNPDDPTGTSMMRRVEDVFDCWFESGSMPFAQVHYPFENKNWFETHFPADFIVEYAAQTRGWFYTLMVLGTALFDKPPFLNCICHGVVLDANGQKLSKRLQNYPDPLELFHQYGADALRWFMVSSPIMRGGELLIDKDGAAVRDTLRLVIKPIWNAYNFFTLYANADGLKAEFNTTSNHLMDRYILSKAKATIETVAQSMDQFDTPAACHAVEQFFEVLNNWYIRRSRHRFWKEEKDQDKQDAYNTLYSVLHLLCHAMAPLLPMVTETIFQGLSDTEEESSIHLGDFPDSTSLPNDTELVATMDKVRDVCNAALSIRNAQNLRVRLPLATLTIVGQNMQGLQEYCDIIQDEVNIKQVVFEEHVEDFASFKLQVNFPVVGKRLPAKMKDIIAASKQGQWESNGPDHVSLAGEELTGNEFTILLEAKEKEATQALSTNDALVVLDLNVTEELKTEGLARDLVRLIQQARKEADFDVSDRISLTVKASPSISQAVTSFKEYISEQTLATSLEEGDPASAPHVMENQLEGEQVVIGLQKVA